MRTHLQSIPLILAICACAPLSQAAPVSFLQSPLAGAEGLASLPGDDQRADNFLFAKLTKVTSVRWWGTYLNNPPTGSDSFTVRFFAPDPFAGGAPQFNPSHQFTGLSIARTDSGLLDSVGDAIYRYEAQLSTPVVFPGGETRYFSVVNGSSNPWFWQRNSNAGTNWFRDSEQVGHVWFQASIHVGNLAFQLIGETPPVGDYNADFTVNQVDYDLWRQNFGSISQLAADGNHNGRVDASDFVLWRKSFPEAMPPAGDYNGDFTVDQLDYNLWKQTFGSTSLLTADGNNNGRVDAADFVIWRRALATAAASGGSLIAVPEPSTCVLALRLPILLGFIIRFRARPAVRG